MQRLAARIAPLGWHTVIYFEHADLDEMGPFLTGLPTDAGVRPHGLPECAEGVDGANFQRFLEVPRRPIRTGSTPRSPARSGSPSPDRPTTMWCRSPAPSSSEFPDRVIWGTDWPHPNMPKEAPDDGVLVDMIPKIAPTAELQRKLLVDNPMRLYWD